MLQSLFNQKEMFSQQLLQHPTSLDFQFQYTQDFYPQNQTLHTEFITQNQDWLRGCFEGNDPPIDYFGDPVYYRRKICPQKLIQTQAILIPEQLQSVTLQDDKYFQDSTQNHIVDNSQPSEDSEQSSGTENRPHPRTAKKIKKLRQIPGNKKQYPTKNLLPAFRPSFLSYLSSHFQPKLFSCIPIIARIRAKKNAINLQDYEDLFCYEPFRPILETYFEEKEIYRFLMMSRINEKTKQIYLSKVEVFQRAFREKSFPKIN